MELPAIRVTGDAVYFPVLVLPMRVGKSASVAAWRRAEANGGELALIHGDSEIATRVRIVQSQAIEGQILGHVAGVERIRVLDVQTAPLGELTASVASVEPTVPGDRSRALMDAMVQCLRADPAVPDAALAMFDTLPLHEAVDVACLNCPDADAATRRVLLSELDIEARADRARPFYERKLASFDGLDTAPQPPAPAPEDDLGEFPDSPSDQATWLLTVAARMGLEPPERLYVGVEHQLDDWMSADPANRALVEERAAEIAAAKRAEEACYPEETEADRLMRVLGSLEEDGILVSLGEWPTQQESVDELRGLATEHEARGWVLFTLQDLVGAVNGQGLYLGFGSHDDGSQIARHTVERLEQAGLPVWWPGTGRVRIYVPIRWQRRMPGA